MAMERSALETQVFSSSSFTQARHADSASGRQDEIKDPGFGAEVTGKTRRRLLNPDGSFNVRREGYSGLHFHNLYHFCLNASWPMFLLMTVCAYLTINAVFALAYLACGPEALHGIHSTDLIGRFLDAFFFSVQTLGTVGYGSITPVGPLPNIIVTGEVLIGLLTFALATGLFFARFSRPTARIRFSKYALISPYRGRTAFEFRIVNERKNQILHLEARLVMSRLEWDGMTMRRKFYDLPLERRQVMFFPLHWTIVHAIDEQSPLSGVTREQLMQSDAEFLVLLAGMDDTFSQTVHAWSSYKHNEILWGAQFGPILDELEDGTLKIDLSRIHDVEFIEEPAAGESRALSGA